MPCQIIRKIAKIPQKTTKDYRVFWIKSSKNLRRIIKQTKAMNSFHSAIENATPYNAQTP